jgi:hypothetical protein
VDYFDNLRRLTREAIRRQFVDVASNVGSSMLQLRTVLSTADDEGGGTND